MAKKTLDPVDKQSPKRVIMTVSMTEEQKQRLKLYAVRHKTSASALVQGWIEAFCQDDE